MIGKKIPKKISQQILTIGPDYTNHRGGIGAVLETYSKYFESFKFLPTYKLGSNVYNVFFFAIFIARYIYKLLSDKRIKVVHIHGSSYGSFFRKLICFLLAKYLFRKKVIYHIHGSEYQVFYKRGNKVTRRLMAFFIAQVDEVLCLSGKWQTFFESNFRRKGIRIIANIVDYPLKAGESSRIKGPITFLFLGLIGDRKGIFDLLDVLSMNTDFYRNKLKLLIGGNGEVEKLKTIIERRRLEEIVEYLGWVSDEQKITCLRDTDVYILPSYNEGLPISILEAMSYGKPVISTDVGGISEIVISKKNGLLINPGNFKQLEQAISFFVNNPDTIPVYGRESMRIVNRHLPKSVVNELMVVYDFVLKP